MDGCGIRSWLQHLALHDHSILAKHRLESVIIQANRQPSDVQVVRRWSLFALTNLAGATCTLVHQLCFLAPQCCCCCSWVRFRAVHARRTALAALAIKLATEADAHR